MTERKELSSAFNTSQPHLQDILNGRNKQLPGLSYKLAGGSYGLDVAFSDQLDIDEKRMCLRIPFADGNHRDGVGDLLEVSGILVDRHRANPIVLFDHGKSISLPIGLAEDPETKQYTVRIDPVAKSADLMAFFYQGRGGAEGVDYGNADYDHAVFCEQLFDLAAKRYIRAGSIGYQVVQAYELPPEPVVGTPKGLHLQKVLMLEGSLVVMPANQDTVRKALSLPKVCGKPLSPMLVKSLAPYAPEKKARLGYEGDREPKTGADSTWGSERGPTYSYDSGTRVFGKEQPSADIDPDKAEQILRDGEVHGKPLTDKQRDMFGAAANKGQKSRLMTVCRGEDGWYVCNVGSNTPEFGPFVSQGIADIWARRLNMGKSIGKVRQKYRKLKQLRQNRTKNAVRKLKKSRQELRNPESTNVHAGAVQTGETVVARRMLVRIPPPPERPTPMNFASSGDRLEVVDASHSRMKVRRSDGETMWVTSNDVRRSKAMGTKGTVGKVDWNSGSKTERSNWLLSADSYMDGREARMLADKRWDELPLEVRRKLEAQRGVKGIKSMKRKDMDETNTSTPDQATEDGGYNMQEPLGAQVLRRFHEDASLLLQDYDEMLGPLENERVKARLQAKAESLAEELEEAEALFGKEYPDLGGLVGMKDDDALEDAADQETDGDPDNSKEEYEEELESTPKDMDTMDDAGNATTSEEKEEPTPEEAVEGMERAEEEEKEEKRLRNRKVKSLRKKYSKKDMCPECQQDPCVCPGDTGTKIAPVVAAVAPAIGSAIGSALSNRDKGYVKEAGGFLGELGQPDSVLDDEGRMKSYHYHKTLEGMGQLEEAHDDLEQTPTEDDIPPAEWEPGEGAKGVVGAVASNPRVRAAARGAVRGAVEGAVTGKAEPGTEEYVQEEMQEPEHQEEENPLVGASSYFKELCTCQDFGDPHREKANHYAKQLNDFVGEDEPTEEESPEGVVMEEEAPMEEEDPGMDVKFLAEEAELQNKKIEELTRMLSRLPV